ncbi:MAG: phage tail protein [Aggregatilineales bacterium]
MIDQPISTASPSGQQIDSLSANEFTVELDGEPASGIFRVAGLTTFKLDVKAPMTKTAREPFTITKMVQRDPQLPFNRWLRESLSARDDIVRPLRTLDIIAIDNGVETRRWRIKGAWISQVSYSEFNTASSELVEETLTIHYEDVEDIWAAAQ